RPAPARSRLPVPSRTPIHVAVSLPARSRRTRRAPPDRRPPDRLSSPMDDWRSYDDVAEIYERVNASHMAEPARDLVAMAGAPPGGRVLDVGTGTGVAAAAAAATLGSEGLAVGVDMSLGMLLQGARARPEIHLAAASAIDLPFRDGTFDAVTANFVVSHFTKYETALFDMIRVLRPGGRLA